MISCSLSLLPCHIHVTSKKKKKTLFTNNKGKEGQEIHKLLLTEKHLIVGFRAATGL